MVSKIPPPLLAGPLTGNEPVWLQQGGAWKRATTGEIARLAAVDVAALTGRVGALERAVAALHDRPEEVAHFTGSAKLPHLTALLPVTLTLSGLVPAVAGDRVRKGETVTVAPAAGLPAGVNIATAYAPADDIVAVQLTSSFNLAAGTAPITWNVTAQR